MHSYWSITTVKTDLCSYESIQPNRLLQVDLRPNLGEHFYNRPRQQTLIVLLLHDLNVNGNRTLPETLAQAPSQLEFRISNSSIFGLINFSIFSKDSASEKFFYIDI